MWTLPRVRSDAMAHRDDVLPLNEALAGALSGLAKRGQPKALGPIWSSAAGEVAAASSRPIAFENGVLRIEADSEAWVTVLREQTRTLAERLAAQLPGFRSLEISQRGGR